MKPFFVIIFLSIFASAEAQTVMTLEDAMKIALQNNYGILVAGNEASASKTNNAWGNAGALPNLSLVGSGNYSISDGKQKTSTGTTTSYSGSTANSISAGVQLNWTMFDGGKMFVTKSKLNELANLGEIQFKDKVLQTQYDVIAAYFNVVRQKQQLTSINEIIGYNEALVKILQTSFQTGSGQKSNMLQAKIDLNVYRENAITQRYTISTAKKTLSNVIGMALDSLFDVSDTLSFNFSFDKNDLLQKLESYNTSILSYQKQFDIAKLSLKEYQKSHYPLVNFSAGYTFSQSNNSYSTIRSNQSVGPQFGGTITIPIFQSGKIKRQVSIAKLYLESAKYTLDGIKLQVKIDLQNAINQYENQQKLLTIENENNALSKENLEISIQRLKLGQTTALEVHLAQENYVQSCTRLINFKYNLKLAETKLKQLLALM
jgi:outer membrane protein